VLTTDIGEIRPLVRRLLRGEEPVKVASLLEKLND